MRRTTKRKLSTFGGCVLAGVTFLGPAVDIHGWQHKRRLCRCFDTQHGR